MSREDPKPGRWILPLVVAGIIGFTYVFVNAIPPAPVTTTIPEATGTTVPPEATTTTTAAPLDPAVAAFLSELDALETEATALLDEAQQINDDWDNENATFSATREAFEALEVDMADYATRVEAVNRPPTVTNWQDAIDAAAAMAAASVDMTEGFLDPDSAAGRRTAFEELNAAGDDLFAAYAVARTAVGG